ncbi:WD repeat domain protein, partial [Reticulomyxa filosa]
MDQVSFHPSGLHLLAGFADKLKLLNVLMDDIRPYKDFHIIRGCTECRFSNGGHLFAAANGDKIYVYSTYSGESLCILRGHSQKIRCLYWNFDDSSLLSAGAEGAVYEWNIFDMTTFQEYVDRQSPLHAALVTKEKKIYACGRKGVLIEVRQSQVEKEVELKVEVLQLAMSHASQRMLFVGTATGVIRSMKLPPSFDKPILIGLTNNSICISPDDVYLFSCGEDGCMNIYEIRDKEGRLAERSTYSNVQTLNEEKHADGSMKSDNSRETLSVTTPWSEEVLVTTKLKNKADELKLHNEYQLRLREMSYQDKLKERADTHSKEMEIERQKYDVLKDEDVDIKMEYEEKIKLNEQQHQEKLITLEAEYQHQLLQEMGTYRELEQQLAKEQTEWEQSVRLQEEAQAKKLEELEIVSTEKIECEEYYRQMQADFDEEIEELKAKYEALLVEEREATLRLKGENGVMKKKFGHLQNEIEDQLEESRKMNIQEQQFKTNITQLKQEIQQLDKQMNERDNVIGDKEKKIHELKKQNQHLEKHKFVLDYKIKASKKQIEPRQHKISEMREEVNTFEIELEQCHGHGRDLKHTIETYKKQLNVLKNKVIHKRNINKKLCAVAEEFGYSLTTLMEYIQDPEKLKDSFIALYSSNQSLLQEPEPQVSEELVAEYNKLKTHLQGRVESLTHQLEQQSKHHQQLHMSIMAENIKYMQQIQELRKELKSITTKPTTSVPVKRVKTHEVLEDKNNIEPATDETIEKHAVVRAVAAEGDCTKCNTKSDKLFRADFQQLKAFSLCIIVLLFCKLQSFWSVFQQKLEADAQYNMEKKTNNNNSDFPFKVGKHSLKMVLRGSETHPQYDLFEVAQAIETARQYLKETERETKEVEHELVEVIHEEMSHLRKEVGNKTNMAQNTISNKPLQIPKDLTNAIRILVDRLEVLEQKHSEAEKMLVTYRQEFQITCLQLLCGGVAGATARTV